MRHAIVTAVFVLVIVPTATLAAPSCGDPDGSSTSAATDALIILKEAVGQSVSCASCACDVNADGRVSATDALTVLNYAVGSIEVLACLADQACAAAPITLSDFAPASGSPSGLLSINGSGFDENALHWIRYFTSDGLSIHVPVVRVSATTIDAPLPPLADGVGAAASSGVGRAQIQVLEKSGSTLTFSDVLAGVEVGAWPNSGSDVGLVTRDFLSGALELGLALENDLVGSALDTPALRDAVQTQLTTLASVIDGVDAVVSGAQTFDLGFANGQSLLVSAQSLGQSDSMILALLKEQAGLNATSGATRVVAAQASGCMSVDALTYYDDAIAGRATTTSRPGYFGSGAACAASAFNTSFAVVGGSAAIAIGVLALGGSAALALSLPAAALLYVSVAAGGGLIAVGGTLGQTTDGAREIVVEGVNRIESTLTSMVEDAVLPGASGTLWSMMDGAKGLRDALVDAAAAPPTTTTTTTTLGADDCWCCCAWWDGCCSVFSCRESATDLSAQIGDLGVCYYYAGGLGLCGNGTCESN